MLKLILPILMVANSIAYAAESFKTEDLANVEITTAVYSQRDQRVLVGIIESNQVGSFLLCDTPAMLANSEVRLSSVSNCVRLPNTRYLATPEMAETVNKFFAPAFEKALAYEKQAYYSSYGESYEMPLMVGVATLGLTAMTTNFAIKDIKANGIGGLATGGAISALIFVGGVLTVLDLTLDAMNQNERLEQRLAPLDDLVKNQVLKIMSDSGTPITNSDLLIKAQDANTEIIFKAIIRALQQAISQASWA